jgi:hypothetical protein
MPGPVARADGAAAPQAAPQAAPAQSAEDQGGESESRGWVADLLRRASTDDEPQAAPRRAAGPEGGNSGTSGAQAAPAAQTGQEAQPAGRSPSQYVESLNSLSVDIARAIDHEASIELWDRYKRGERSVFTRRLYTLQGQKTFDEIRRKYERESEFRGAVDRYIDDFEQLLSQVARNDHDPLMSQMYLTSDTGKVYTMLAHAAGRLG